MQMIELFKPFRLSTRASVVLLLLAGPGHFSLDRPVFGERPD